MTIEIASERVVIEGLRRYVMAAAYTLIAMTGGIAILFFALTIAYAVLRLVGTIL